MLHFLSTANPQCSTFSCLAVLVIINPECNTQETLLSIFLYYYVNSKFAKAAMLLKPFVSDWLICLKQQFTPGYPTLKHSTAVRLAKRRLVQNSSRQDDENKLQRTLVCYTCPSCHNCTVKCEYYTLCLKCEFIHSEVQIFIIAPFGLGGGQPFPSALSSCL